MGHYSGGQCAGCDTSHKRFFIGLRNAGFHPRYGWRRWPLPESSKLPSRLQLAAVRYYGARERAKGNRTMSAMRHHPPICPECGVELRYVDLQMLRPFNCSNCKKPLLVSAGYASVFRWVGTSFGFLIALCFYSNGWLVAILAGCVSFCAYGVFGSIFAKRLITPTIRPYTSSNYTTLFTRP